MMVLIMYVALLVTMDVSGEGSQPQYLFAGIAMTAYIGIILTEGYVWRG